MIKNLEMRLYWLILVGPKSITNMLIRDRQMKRSYTQREEDDVKMEAEIRVTWPQTQDILVATGSWKR